MAMDLVAAGKKGVVINALYDFWTPSRHYQAYHAGMRILSESASAKLATPIVVRPEQIQATGLGYNPRERSWNYLEPWEGGTWRLRDIRLLCGVAICCGIFMKWDGVRLHGPRPMRSLSHGRRPIPALREKCSSY
jgi:hypothetical protein